MRKITLIGAGGVIFAQKFIKDILLDATLKNSEIALMDIDAGRLKNAEIFTQKISEKLGLEPDVFTTTDLREAVRNADYVITLFRVGTLEHQWLEQEIPRKYGVDQVVADTLGPGGVFRGLRTLKALFKVLEVMEEVCPGAYLLNYVNPMSMNTIALSRRTKTIKVGGLCHSVQCTSEQLTGYIGAEKSAVRFLFAGINHQAFCLKFELNGKDAYPRLRKAMDDKNIYRQDRIRFEIFRHFGYFPSESSGHGSEYIPYIRKRRDLIEKFCSLPPDAEKDYDMSAGTSGAALKVCAELQEKNEKQLKALLSGKEEIDLNYSNEYAVRIIKAIETDTPVAANLNVMNRGLIPSLPPECSVEVPCLVNGSGIMPCRINDYPEQLAGLNRGMINVQLLGAEGALTCDREKIFQAIALDPLTAAVCSLNEIQAMTDELFDALKSEISEDFHR
ncbi:MAG: alpha-galactosidase [Victivallaceae bacterium]|nr:alpha-galactosidase [Victivallaceae bacterium]